MTNPTETRNIEEKVAHYQAMRDGGAAAQIKYLFLAQHLSSETATYLRSASATLTEKERSALAAMSRLAFSYDLGKGMIEGAYGSYARAFHQHEMVLMGSLTVTQGIWDVRRKRKALQKEANWLFAAVSFGRRDSIEDVWQCAPCVALDAIADRAARLGMPELEKRAVKAYTKEQAE
tara:strand:- start:24418 stop:24948 length:531 start_codon:yes stop_codon:yes gene_type:complete